MYIPNQYLIFKLGVTVYPILSQSHDAESEESSLSH